MERYDHRSYEAIEAIAMLAQRSYISECAKNRPHLLTKKTERLLVKKFGEKNEQNVTR